MTDFRQEWVEALRSGRYAQGARRLRQTTPDGQEVHCCLGVAADLIDPDGWETLQATVTNVQYVWHGSRTTVLPPFLHKGYHNLATLNDRGISFEIIAKVIEQVDPVYLDTFTDHVINKSLWEKEDLSEVVEQTLQHPSWKTP